MRVWRIAQALRKEERSARLNNHYAQKGRLVESGTYNALKDVTRCQNCHKKLGGHRPEIHHKIPLSRGGSNDKGNLLAVCRRCHAALDAGARPLLHPPNISP